MKGDVLVLEKYHIEAGEKIAQTVIDKINDFDRRYIISVSGESGSGKSETARAISNALARVGIVSVVLGQDDYFYLPPKLNDLKRREDVDWLGPHIEVQMDLFNEHINAAIVGVNEIKKTFDQL